MEFFDKIGKKASEAYKVTADKTGKIAREAKLKMKMGDLKGQINDIYKEIGKKVYEKHIREENVNIKEELEEECTKIDVLSAEVENILKECMELKDKKQCDKCYTEIDIDVNFCPQCGAKQEQEPVKEGEILSKIEKVENVSGEQKDVKSDNDQEQKQEECKKQNEENEQSKNNLEKTVAIESDVKTDEEELD